MKSRIYLGNLPFKVTKEEIIAWLHPTHAFDVKIVTDKETGRPKGFGFVNIETDNLDELIRRMDGAELGGRPIRVNRANDKATSHRRDDSRAPRGNRRDDYSDSWRDR